MPLLGTSFPAQDRRPCAVPGAAIAWLLHGEGRNTDYLIYMYFYAATSLPGLGADGFL